MPRQLFLRQKTLSKLVRVYQPIIPITLGDHIKNRRKILRLLQKDIAPMLGVCEASVSQGERKSTIPFTVHYPLIAQFLGYEWWQFDTNTLASEERLSVDIKKCDIDTFVEYAKKLMEHP